jgi:putative tryptophan/tyrosine transport system substrate-binding protein
VLTRQEAAGKWGAATYSLARWGRRVQLIQPSWPTDLRSILALFGTVEKLTKDRADALLVLSDTFLVSQRSRIAQFAIENKLPSAYTFREHVEAGGLIAYTPKLHDSFRRAAIYLDKILKGAKPGDLPIEQPTKFELVINLKTAKALGLTVPLIMQMTADEVIE